MKSVLIFLAVLGVAYGAVAQPLAAKDLNDDMQDFVALIPVDLIIEHTMDYMQHDEEFQTILYFLFSDEFAYLFRALLEVPEVIEYAQFLRDHGLQLDRYIAWVREFLGLSRENKVRVVASRGGLSGWLNGLLELLPIDEIRALAAEKLETSESFRTIYEALRSEEFQEVIRRLRANETYQSIVDILASYGIDTVRIGEVFLRIFGWDL